jgi:serine/threonine protein kinase
MIGETLSHYRIISKIGSGGMGDVYLAEDTRLDRKVAVKVLPAGLTRDASRVRRFEQEARAASALNHPNIVTIHEIGEAEVGCFIQVARRQSAKAFELRAAMGLAKLWNRQDRRQEARDVLAEIYGRFTEGFDTVDLKDAKALLDELSFRDAGVVNQDD